MLTLLITFPEDSTLEDSFFFRSAKYGQLTMDQDLDKVFHLLKKELLEICQNT